MVATLAATVGLAVAAAPASASFNASISGRVTDGNSGIFNVAVQVYDSNHSQVSSGSVFTDATGHYTAFITDFMPSPDNVTVRFGGPYGQNWADEWYNGSLTAQGATPFSVSSGQSVIGISAALVQRGGIAGKTAQAGEAVTLYNANGSLTGQAVASGSGGSYTFSGLQPGTSYKLCFEHSCYNGKPAAPAGLASADLIPVFANSVTGHIDEQQAAVKHTLTVSEAGAGSGSVTGSGISCPGTCSHSYSAGTSVHLTAVPALGSTFTRWSGACAGTGACSVTMSADQAVAATFTRVAGAPSAAQIKALLSSEIVPGGKAAKIKALLKAGAFVELFKALEAGRAVVAWYQLPSGAHLTTKTTKSKPVLVATGRLTFTAAGSAKLAIKLSPAGKQLLKHAKHVKLTAKGTFTPVGKPAVTTTKTFTLKS